MPRDVIYPGTTIECDVVVTGQASPLAASVAAGASVITVYDASRWLAGQVLKIGEGDPQSTDSEIRTIAGAGITGNVVTLTAALGFGHARDTPVYRILDATMTASVRLPDATTTALSLSSVTTGRYRGLYVPTQSGAHDIEAAASGTVTAVNAERIEVLTDRV
jgi:hypothetical protein